MTCANDRMTVYSISYPTVPRYDRLTRTLPEGMCVDVPLWDRGTFPCPNLRFAGLLCGTHCLLRFHLSRPFGVCRYYQPTCRRLRACARLLPRARTCFCNDFAGGCLTCLNLLVHFLIAYGDGRTYHLLPLFRSTWRSAGVTC